MLIRTDKEVMPHVNPTLKVGYTYQIVSGPAHESRVGRIFTVYNSIQDRRSIIYLAEVGRSGGWDDAAILADRGMNYKEVDLTFPTEQ